MISSSTAVDLIESGILVPTSRLDQEILSRTRKRAARGNISILTAMTQPLKSPSICTGTGRSASTEAERPSL
jgi:hypothetical protein